MNRLAPFQALLDAGLTGCQYDIHITNLIETRKDAFVVIYDCIPKNDGGEFRLTPNQRVTSFLMVDGKLVERNGIIV